MLFRSDLTPERMASEIAKAMTCPEQLVVAAEAARAAGLPDAVARLADLVEEVAAKRR